MSFNALFRTIQDYTLLRSGILEGARRLIRVFDELKLREVTNDRNDANLEAGVRVLNSFRTAEFCLFDIFQIAGFKPSENYLSNAIAALLDPSRPHQLGLSFLRFLLQSDRLRSEHRASIILNILEEDTDLRVTVRREFLKRTTDIAVITNRFIIFIENKKRGGREGKGQTHRQWIVLQRLGERLGISPDCLLPIYLTPDGDLPLQSEFVPIRVDEVVTSIRSVLYAKISNSPSHRLIEAFVDFYERYNY